MVALAQGYGMAVRAGIQCAFGYQEPGDVSLKQVVDIARQHLALDIDELALADSSGLANPRQLGAYLETIIPLAGEKPVVLHLHDTRGMGLANVLAALRCGVRHFDTAFGGLGGCPFIDDATGNIATEDTAYMMETMGIAVGIDINRLAQVSRRFEQQLEKTLPGKLYKLSG
jgi:hydroxymethylglutaryl-CoA lyase